MDKLEKKLNKLSSKERKKIKAVLLRLKAGNVQGFDIKKLKDRDDIFRIRSGDIRIIYRLADKQILVLAIERRNEKTYKSH